MAAQTKLKRSMRKGLRAIPPQIPSQKLNPPPGVRRATVEKMRKFLFEEVLLNGKTRAELTPRQLFGVDQAHLVILFHQGEKDFQDVKRHSRNGHRDEIGFDEEEISAFNFIFLEEKRKGQLESLLKRLEGKMIEAKK